MPILQRGLMVELERDRRPPRKPSGAGRGRRGAAAQGLREVSDEGTVVSVAVSGLPRACARPALRWHAGVQQVGGTGDVAQPPRLRWILVVQQPKQGRRDDHEGVVAGLADGLDEN